MKKVINIFTLIGIVIKKPGEALKAKMNNNGSKYSIRDKEINVVDINSFKRKK